MSSRRRNPTLVFSSASVAAWVSTVILGLVFFVSAAFGDGPAFDLLEFLGLYFSLVGIPGVVAGLLAQIKAVSAFMDRGVRQKFFGYIITLATWLVLILVAEIVVNKVNGEGYDWLFFDFLVWSVSATFAFAVVVICTETVAGIRSRRLG